ncbi:recombination-associated protein RdgC [Thorsellia anophelis]|nr:recombination-associated protein RdgC [Thorsellia anophelis]
MWFTNARIYQLKEDESILVDNLNDLLARESFKPCQSQEIMKMGWGAPLDINPDLFLHQVAQQRLLVMRKEEKMLPAQVIKQQLQLKINEVETATNRKLSKAEKATLKEEVIITLLPRAFSRYSQTWMWIDLPNKRIIINSASAKRSEEILSLLRKTVGSLPVVPLIPDVPLENTMTTWLVKDELPSFMQFGQEAELKSSETDGGVIRCKQQDLQTDEILQHIENSKLVTNIALNWREKVDFILTNEAVLKRIKFTDVVKEQNSDIDKSDYAQRFDADFVLMSGELTKLIDDLFS